MVGLIYYIINILSETFTLLFLPCITLRVEFTNININTQLQYLTLRCCPVCRSASCARNWYKFRPQYYFYWFEKPQNGTNSISNLLLEPLKIFGSWSNWHNSQMQEGWTWAWISSVHVRFGCINISLSVVVIVLPELARGEVLDTWILNQRAEGGEGESMALPLLDFLLSVVCFVLAYPCPNVIINVRSSAVSSVNVMKPSSVFLE